MFILLRSSWFDLFVPPGPDRGCDTKGIVDLGKMVTAMHHDGAMLGKEPLKACEPAQFEQAIRLTKDQQGWHLLLRSSRLSEARRGSVVGGTDRCRERAQALLQISEIVMAPHCALEQFRRVAPHRTISHWFSIGSLLLVGKGLLRFSRQALERVLQQQIEVDAQEAEQGRADQLDHAVNPRIILQRPDKPR